VPTKSGAAFWAVVVRGTRKFRAGCLKTGRFRSRVTSVPGVLQHWGASRAPLGNLRTMRRFTIITLLLSCITSGAAKADGADLEDQVRQILLDNPEIILEALTILAEREARAETRARIAEFPDLFEGTDALGIGSVDAPIRVIEFFDYKCVPCKAIHPALVAFVAEEPSVRIEMRHLPILTPGSERAARFALAVKDTEGEAAYADVHNMLWDVKGPLNDAGFERIAAELDLDFARIEPVMDSDAISARIDYNRDVAIALEVLGTPAFVTPDSVTFGLTEIDVLSDAWLSR